MKMRFKINRRRPAADAQERPACGTFARQSGIALVITLIMLSVTLIMAMAFLAVARRETTGVSQQKDNKTAQLAAETAVTRAQAQIAASMLASLRGQVSSNAYNLHLFVSTNLINPNGFSTATPAFNSPTNVNYYDAKGNFLTGNNFLQNVANLMILPRAPVFVSTNPAGSKLDFRFYLDLNENGNFEPNGWQAVISSNSATPYYDTNRQPQSTMVPGNVLSNFMVGDPEWVGILEHPDEPHGPENHFLSRYAFIALPSGNALDVNYIHNEALSTGTKLGEGYLRNQGVGSWELNLAAFLADLETNQWSPPRPASANLYYAYDEPLGSVNRGYAFEDALALLKYRYNSNTLPLASRLFNNPLPLVRNNIDNFSRGPVQTNVNYYRNFFTPLANINGSWSGADSTNHYFSLFDWLDGSKTGSGVNSFTNRLRTAGASAITTSSGILHPTYDSYAFYRMLDEMASDSSPDDGRLNLNYSNAAVSTVNGVLHVNIIPGAETNFVRWEPTNFFLAAADQMLRTYSSFWYSQNSTAYTNTFAFTNSSFGITNIPVWVSNRFVYTPAVHRLLQLAANIYDASTNDGYNLPHVYRPLFRCERNANRDIYIAGYVAVNSVSPTGVDPQLASPYDITQLGLLAARQGYVTPIMNPANGTPVNAYGVPWIVGAKKGLPNFNQLSLLTSANVVRKLELTRTSLDPKTAVYGTNQAYIMWVTNQVGVTFWNSYSNAFSSPLGQTRVVVSDSLNMCMTNPWHNFSTWPLHANYSPTNFYTNVLISSWPGYSSLNNKSFLSCSWPVLYQSPLVYNDSAHSFAGGTFEKVSQLDQLGLLVTNYLQAYILVGNRVVDYVQLRDPITVGGINQALADPNYGVAGNTYYQWSTNLYGKSAGPYGVPYGVVNQLWVSGHPNSAPAVGGQWSTAATPMGVVSPAGEAAFFHGFFTRTFLYNGKLYENKELAIQAPYTPYRTVYSSYLLQANDPLVHYSASDLNAEFGALGIWANGSFYNGIWHRSDDPLSQPLPVPPLSPVGGRYQPWGSGGQMAALGSVDSNPYNLAYRDPLMVSADRWDFPTNQYPTPGWLGRVHRGTPWQTVFLKSTNILSDVNGLNTWAHWTGNIQTNYYGYFDAVNSAPNQDYLLFDIFTTRYNDNSARGTLPVNVGMGRSDGGLAAWSAVFSGMTALTNTLRFPLASTPLTYANHFISPAGVDVANSALWKIVNGTNGINATRANTNLFPQQVFTHPGQILATPALTVASPFLNATNYSNARSLTGNPFEYGINDEMYEWLPQQMMGLVRGTEQRYVLYCFGQTLKPASNGKVLSGTFAGLVTNYQVTAESVVRAVIRVDNANTSHPRAVVESYNTLPPY